MFVFHTVSYSAPLVAPTILSLRRTNSTSALIEWERLGPQDLRGYLTSYLIVFFKLSDTCTPVSSSAQSYENRSSVPALSPVFSLIDLLDPRHEYCVGVAAVTGAGTGAFSYKSVSCKIDNSSTMSSSVFYFYIVSLRV